MGGGGGHFFFFFFSKKSFYSSSYVSVALNKMAAMPIYGKNTYKASFLEPRKL